MIKKQIDKLNKHQKIVGGSLLLVYLLLLLGGFIFLKEHEPKVKYTMYMSNRGGFQVIVPNGDMEQSTTMCTVKEKTLTQYLYTSSAPGITYTVAHIDLPFGLITPPELVPTLNNIVNRYIDTLKCEVLSSENIKFDDYDGIAVLAERIDEATKVTYTVKAVKVSNRIYLAGIEGKRKKLTKYKVERFFNSFKFVF